MRTDVSSKTHVGFAIEEGEGGAVPIFQKATDRNTVVAFYVDAVDEDKDGPFVIIGEDVLRVDELLQALRSYQLAIKYRVTLQVNDTAQAERIGVNP